MGLCAGDDVFCESIVNGATKVQHLKKECAYAFFRGPRSDHRMIQQAIGIVGWAPGTVNQSADGGTAYGQPTMILC